MMLVDDQSGSKDLYPYIRALTTECLLTRIDPPFADIAWYGNGPDDKQVKVGVEYKKLPDVLDCMMDGRFAAHQAVGMVEHYDRRYLLIEMQRHRFDRNNGILQRMKGNNWYDVMRNGRGFTYRDLEHWVTTVEEQAQFRVVKVYDEYESARWTFSKYTWYTAKGWDEHDSFKQFHVPPPPTAAFVKPNVVRRVAKEIGGIGWDRSIPVATHFGSVYNLATADASDWASIQVGEDKNGHKITIGKNRAIAIVKEIRGTP